MSDGVSFLEFVVTAMCILLAGSTLKRSHPIHPHEQVNSTITAPIIEDDQADSVVDKVAQDSMD